MTTPPTPPGRADPLLGGSTDTKGRPVVPSPTRPDPTIIGDPGGRCPLCAVCKGIFHGDDWETRKTVRRWLRRRPVHSWCLEA